MKKADFDAMFKSVQGELLKEFSPEKIEERLSKRKEADGKISYEELLAKFFFMNLEYSTKLVYSVLSKMLDIEE